MKASPASQAKRGRRNIPLPGSADPFRVVVENAVDGMYIITPEGFEYINPAFARMLGYTTSEILAKDFDTYGPIHPDDRKIVSGRLKAVRTGTPVPPQYKMRILNKGGKIRHVEVNTVLLPGEKLRALGTVRDISERVQAEERYRELVENAGIAIVTDDRNGNFLYANERCTEIFGYDHEEMKRQSIASLVHPDELKRVMGIHKGRLQGKPVPDRYSFKGVRKDGDAVYLEVYALPVMEGGKRVGTRSYLWDITGRKKAEVETLETLEKLRKNLNGTINAISLAVEARDPFTSGHQRRVADLARTIGTQMGIPKDQVEGIRTAGVIHDLGKISVPADILSKPGQLNEWEFSIIKSHPQVAYDILKDIEFPWPVAMIIHQHHERMDGSGYPRGLSDDNILLEARILAVADVVEAMSSHRPYRPALGLKAALQEISEHKGTLYDTAAVDICLDLFATQKFKFK